MGTDTDDIRTQNRNPRRSSGEVVHAAWVALLKKHTTEKLPDGTFGPGRCGGIECSFRLGSNASKESRDWPDSFRTFGYVEGFSTEQEYEHLAAEHAQNLWDLCQLHADEQGGRVFYELKLLAYNGDDLEVIATTTKGGFLDVTGDRPTRQDVQASSDRDLAMTENREIIRTLHGIIKTTQACVERVLNSAAGLIDSTSKASVSSIERMQAAGPGEVEKARFEAENRRHEADLTADLQSKAYETQLSEIRTQEAARLGEKLLNMANEKCTPEVVQTFVQNFMNNKKANSNAAA